MRADWDSNEDQSRHLTAKEEARLITNLAQHRAGKARRHPAACTCGPCKVRRYDTNRRHTAELCNHTDATRGNRNA